jgi:hypothetical protein
MGIGRDIIDFGGDMRSGLGDMWREHWYGKVFVVTIVAMFLVVACLPFYGIDAALSHEVGMGTAVVVTRSYTPSQLATGMAGGKVAVTSTSEKWMVIVKRGDAVAPVRTTPAKWATLEPGQSVELVQNHGVIYEGDLWVKE